MKTETNILWPPEITVKKHPRAKHVKLRATIKNGLELTVPNRFNMKDLPYILNQNRAWIEKQLLKIVCTSDIQNELPTEIEFPCIQQRWTLQYQHNTSKLTMIMRPHQECVVSGNIENILTCKKFLISWIKKLASDHLSLLLNKISSEINVPYSTHTIRNQSSRWGSCSSRGSISLNFKLIFLPLELTRHIIIHELCHTKVLNHSDKFWKCVAQYDLNWQKHRAQMKHADQYIPRWIEGV